MLLQHKPCTNKLAAEPCVVLRTTSQIYVAVKWMRPRDADAPPSGSDDVQRPQKRCYSSPNLGSGDHELALLIILLLKASNAARGDS